MKQFRCRECTLLRVDCEGGVCEECAANLPAQAPVVLECAGTINLNDCYSGWSDCSSPPSSLLVNTAPEAVTPEQIMCDLESMFDFCQKQVCLTYMALVSHGPDLDCIYSDAEINAGKA